MMFSFLSVTPRISKKDGKLVAKTSFVGFLISLTVLHRTVVVDPKSKSVTMTRRWLWFLKSRKRIRFKRIAGISYKYEDWNPISGMGFTGDSFDCFTVKLKLHNGKGLHLFRFVGEGTFSNKTGYYPDWMYWGEYATDMSGTQDAESRAFVNLLQSIVKVPLV